MNLQALQDCLIVEPEVERHEWLALIGAKKTGTGIVRAVGPKASDTKVGDRILFGEFVGQDFRHEGKDCLVMREEHILGVFE